MVITQKSLHRRTFLKGTGAAFALPLLDAMTPAFAAAAAPADPHGLRRGPQWHHEPRQRIRAEGHGRSRDAPRSSSRWPTSRTA